LPESALATLLSWSLSFMTAAKSQMEATMLNREAAFLIELPGADNASLLEMSATYGTLHRDSTVALDFRAVCLWSALGLTVTGFFVVGFGAEIGQALMMAG